MPPKGYKKKAKGKVDSHRRPVRSPRAAVVDPERAAEAEIVIAQLPLPRIDLDASPVELGILAVGDKFSVSGQLYEKVETQQWGVDVVRIRAVPGGFEQVELITMGATSLVCRIK